MRLLQRNLTEFEYIPQTEETDIDPETGMHTGEFRQMTDEELGEDTEPILCEGNISTASQYATYTLFGTDIRYTHVLVMDYTEVEIDEYGKITLNGDPDVEINEYGKIRWNGDLYDIRAVRPSLNSVSIALRKQTKNHTKDEGEDGE